MPNYIWEKVDKIIDLVVLLSPIIVVMLILLFIGSLIFTIQFNKKHNVKLRKFEKNSEENRKCIKQYRKKYFPKE